MMKAVWDKIKAGCLRSLTIAWSYVVAAASAIMLKIDDLASLVGDATFGKQVEAVIGADPKVLGKWLGIAALITIVSRLRGIVAKPKP